jgi:hypothetical protein
VSGKVAGSAVVADDIKLGGFLGDRVAIGPNVSLGNNWDGQRYFRELIGTS